MTSYGTSGESPGRWHCDWAIPPRTRTPQRGRAGVRRTSALGFCCRSTSSFCNRHYCVHQPFMASTGLRSVGQRRTSALSCSAHDVMKGSDLRCYKCVGGRAS